MDKSKIMCLVDTMSKYKIEITTDTIKRIEKAADHLSLIEDLFWDIFNDEQQIASDSTKEKSEIFKELLIWSGYKGDMLVKPRWEKN